MRWIAAMLLMAGWALAQVPVSATTGFIADMVQNVGGNRISLTLVVPQGADPHSFEPKPSAVAAVAKSRLLFANGLELEPFLDKLVAQLPKGAKAVKLAEGIPRLIQAAHQDEHGDEHADEHGHGEYDPHLWLDPANGVRYVEKIRDALIALDAAGRSIYTANAANYITLIRRTDAEVRECLKSIPVAKRKIVSQHEALLYFARAYSITIVGTLADYAGQERGPARFAKLANEMKKQGVRTVFAEPQFSVAEAQALAEATGAKVGRIYSDAFDDKVNTYLRMIRANGQAVCQSLQ